MKQIVFIMLLLVLPFSTLAQKRYRFSVGGGLYSLMYWGLKDIDNVQSPGGSDYFQVYENETYTLDYRNFQFSNLYKINFGINWFSRRTFEIHQSFSFFKGKFNDELNLTLTQAEGVGDYFYPDSTYSAANVYPGIQGKLLKEGGFGGISTALSFRKLTAKKYWYGAGAGVNYFGSSDEGAEWKKISGYSVISGFSRGRHNYVTAQLFLLAEFGYRFKFIEVYVRAAQHLVTVKKHQSIYTWKEYSITPNSHNFDYRFPFSFETGISFSFDHIRRLCVKK